ncbi:type II toxin-antitoxin system PemK/MazF family toxin [Evansella cellulosilytica]|uniref:Uncharacterized protein n=1 Tax=Evansella cellulosilytica (strain ATCC 21833 / DSM 2522 / FERM P-1141 / JCM 9156 / N-4) TaxID=649639 RepID=E6TQH5_EVAC2|nr:type II toxin-antitoxin system PemK/MazF family toxin [Evansella cellulosilytica]ADU29353.1 hypothetical protein Bcell_1083 [Evansella cellulosilytica DSM 2522]
MSDKLNKIARDRRNADQGDFFFAKVRMSNGQVIPRPVFVIGKDNDSNDDEDVIVCKCTKEPARSEYDITVQLKYETSVRTNKIYTIGKSQLEFKIKHNLDIAIINNLVESSKKAIY